MPTLNTKDIAKQKTPLSAWIGLIVVLIVIYQLKKGSDQRNVDSDLSRINAMCEIVDYPTANLAFRYRQAYAPTAEWDERQIMTSIFQSLKATPNSTLHNAGCSASAVDTIARGRTAK